MTVVPLSTSSSDIRTPQHASRFSLLAGCAIAIAILFLIEVGLRHHGMKPVNTDTKELWAAQRARASALGRDALILVGASRIQLGMDLEVLKSNLQLKPVQLAIDGTSFLPILEDLVADPSITGTLIVSLNTGVIGKSKERFKSTEWLEFYNREYRGLFSPAIEKRLKAKVKSLSNIYSSGIPLPRLFRSALGREPVPRDYLITDAQRERDADYTLVQQPAFYLARVLRHLGKHVYIGGRTTLAQAIQEIRKAIPSGLRKKRQPANFVYINELTQRLRQRGGRVVFVRFPTSGLVWEIDQARLPKEYDWDQFARYSLAPTIHFMDYPELQYQLADGSHLDQSQKQAFTRSLARIIGRELDAQNDYQADLPHQ